MLLSGSEWKASKVLSDHTEREEISCKDDRRVEPLRIRSTESAAGRSVEDVYEDTNRGCEIMKEYEYLKRLGKCISNGSVRGEILDEYKAHLEDCQEALM